MKKIGTTILSLTLLAVLLAPAIPAGAAETAPAVPIDIGELEQCVLDEDENVYEPATGVWVRAGGAGEATLDGMSDYWYSKADTTNRDVALKIVPAADGWLAVRYILDLVIADNASLYDADTDSWIGGFLPSGASVDEATWKMSYIPVTKGVEYYVFYRRNTGADDGSTRALYLASLTLLQEADFERDTLEIGSKTELDAFAQKSRDGDDFALTTVKLTADIAYDGEWEPLGDFSGRFDGGGHVISGLDIVPAGGNDAGIGFFSRLGGNGPAALSDLYLADVTVDAEACVYVGALAGLVQDASVSRCGVLSGEVSGDRLVGGLIGGVYDATVDACYSAVSVTSVMGQTGGLIGLIANITLTNSWASGGVTATGTIRDVVWEGQTCASVGGLVGDVAIFREDNVNRIVNCWASGDVKGYLNVGGLAGSLYNSTVIHNSHASGSVTGKEDAGLLIGYIYLDETDDEAADFDNLFFSGGATLTVDGTAAAAKAVGDQFEDFETDFEALCTKVTLPGGYADTLKALNDFVADDDGDTALFAWGGAGAGGLPLHRDIEITWYGRDGAALHTAMAGAGEKLTDIYAAVPPALTGYKNGRWEQRGTELLAGATYATLTVESYNRRALAVDAVYDEDTGGADPGGNDPGNPPTGVPADPLAVPAGVVILGLGSVLAARKRKK